MDRSARFSGGSSGRSNTKLTNAAVTSTMYVLVTAPRRLPPVAISTSNAILNAPMKPASTCEAPGRSPCAGRAANDRCGAISSNAAHGRPTRLAGAHATNASVARIRRDNDGRAATLGGMSLDIGDQRELAGAFDRGGELALMARAHAGQAARQNLASLREEAAQGPVVLIIEHACAGFAHGTGLGGTSHASSSSSSSSSAPTLAGTTGLGCSRAASTMR